MFANLVKRAILVGLAIGVESCGATVDEHDIQQVRRLGANLLDSIDDPAAWHQFDSLRHDRTALEHDIDSLAQLCDFDTAKWTFTEEKVMTRLDGPDHVTLILDAVVNCGSCRLAMTYDVLDEGPVLRRCSLRIAEQR